MTVAAIIAALAIGMVIGVLLDIAAALNSDHWERF